MSQSTLLLAHASARPRRAASHLIRRERSFTWLFLSDDYLRFLRWREALEPIAEPVSAATLVRAAASRLRTPFLDRITELGRRYDSLAWWTSRVSERNTMVSPLFLHCCYVSAALSALDDAEEDTCVVCQSWAVLESLATLAESRGWMVSWVTKPNRARRRLVTAGGAVARCALWLATSWAPGERHGAGRVRAEPDKPLALIRTWVDDACLGTRGAFRDRYFPGVAEWLDARGWRVATVPVLFNTERSARSTWEWCGSSPQSFLNPRSLYRWADYVFSLRTARRQTSIPAGPVPVEGIDATRLFDEERKRWAFDRGSLDAILSYRLPRRLAEAGLEVDLFIDPFENMLYEKALNLGFRRYQPRTRLVGVQPAAVYPLHLCLFVTRGEAEFAPLPDRVVCSGSFFRDLLIREGLPTDLVAAGPALRYTHLWQTPRSPQPRPADGACVLVLLSLVQRPAVELLLKAIEAFGTANDLRVLVKPHPMAPVGTLLHLAGIERLPAHFEPADEAMADALAQARVAVAMETNSVYESLAAGVPVVVAGRSAGLDLNPLAWHDGLSAVFSEPEEIRAETRRLLALAPEELDAYRERGREILRESFNPVTDETMSALVDGLVGPRQARS